MIRTSLGEGCNSFSMESCRFVTTAVGIVVYAGNGDCLGMHETENAAVEMVRLMISDGGSADEV